MNSTIKKLTGISIIALLISSCSTPVENGYTDKTSYTPKEKIEVFLSSEKPIKGYELELTDVNRNEVKSYKVDLINQEPKSSEPYKNGFNYDVTLTTQLPDLKSGIYFWDEEIPFVVKPESTPRIMVLYSSNTENAYAESGGKSLYAFNSSNKEAAKTVSFQRPIKKPFHSFEFLQWLSEEPYTDIGYICDLDMEEYKNIAGSDLLIIPGHSEYWTRKARKNFDRYVAEGKNVLLLSGNTMWWQVRYSEDRNQLICYKSSEKDPISDTLLRTITWPLAELDYPVYSSIGLDFNLGGFGKDEDNGWDGFKITNQDSPLLKGSGLENGDILSLPSDEYDGAELTGSYESGDLELINNAGFYKYELIGYDLGSRKDHSNGAWIVMQKTPESGVIINGGSTDWCSKTGMVVEDHKQVKHLIKNMIDLLLMEDKGACFTKI